MPDNARRILFALNEPGYFRFYGPTIVELERRGWDVVLVYDKPEKRGPDRIVPGNAGERVRSLGTLPGVVPPAAKELRIALDCVRYLEPAFARAEYLRRRAQRELSPAFAFITRIKRLPRFVVSALIRVARLVERLLPVSAATLEFLKHVQPDVLFVSPLVIIGGSGVAETEVLKAARELRIPSIVGVASWDHLTSKGLIRIVPDAVTVWNDAQADEAVRLHRIPRNRVLITGAQSFDRWFDRAGGDAVSAFRRGLGVPDNRRMLLLVGSSPNMAPGDSEVRFARRWISAIRGSRNPDVRDASVIVRPHPGNTDPWRDVDLGDANAIVYPTSYASGILLTHSEVDAFWYSLLASSAVIGVNTTAMIEAAIVRRPVFAVRDPAFAHSQDQTLHFDYLSSAEDGFTIVSDSLPDHVRQVEDLFESGNPDLRRSDAFVARFVRPLGMTTSATLHLCDAIERVAATHLAPRARATAESMAVDTHDAISSGR